MEFILNEESLKGQFTTVQDFLESLKSNIRCFHIIRKSERNTISKIDNFYDCYVTSDIRIRDLHNCPCSDELVAFQYQLEQEIYNLPHWDKNPMHDLSKAYLLEESDMAATGIAEATERDHLLLSFDMEKFKDCTLHIQAADREELVSSIYSPAFLVECVGKQLGIHGDDILKIRYEGTRIDCSSIEMKYGTEILNENQLQQIISSMDKFVKHETWENIDRDDGLEYKKYTPDSPKHNWYNGSMYRDKQIMKFRASSLLRVHGYRKGDKFRVLRFEIDHKQSDHG